MPALKKAPIRKSARPPKPVKAAIIPKPRKPRVSKPRPQRVKPFNDGGGDFGVSDILDTRVHPNTKTLQGLTLWDPSWIDVTEFTNQSQAAEDIAKLDQIKRIIALQLGCQLSDIYRDTDGWQVPFQYQEQFRQLQRPSPALAPFPLPPPPPPTSAPLAAQVPPLSASAPFLAPGPGPVPAPAPGPGPGPVPALAPGPGFVPAPAPGPGPGVVPAPAPGPGFVPAPAPGPGPGPGSAPALGLLSQHRQRRSASVRSVEKLELRLLTTYDPQRRIKLEKKIRSIRQQVKVELDDNWFPSSSSSASSSSRSFRSLSPFMSRSPSPTPSFQEFPRFFPHLPSGHAEYQPYRM
ncbi:hypothetical protein A4X13_0g8173 [Tilletia indica]|uniref:Uncharacterized protein n=1 Tax=Tilletia indica TaxID=43049 RepID=A0A8T8SG77_9BASI|nr:hypothetical protein A4X13_0g8173 [Tilletia indica]